MAVVFWEPGKLEAAPGNVVEVDQACALLFDAQARRVVVADPSQTLASLTITLAGLRRQVALPKGGEAGQSTMVQLE